MSLNLGAKPQMEAAAAGTDVCKFCGQGVAGQYYRVNGRMACPTCVEKLNAQRPKPNQALWMRALLLGAGAAVVGMLAYAAFEIGTGFTIGYAALGVGWLIAKAMLAGSKGEKGRRYQIAAVLLTYMAVSVAAVPVGLWQMSKERAANAAQPQHLDQAGQPSPGQDESVGTAVVKLVGVGLVSPLVELADGVGGVIGLVILFVGMQIAWKMLDGGPKIVVDGPF